LDARDKHKLLTTLMTYHSLGGINIDIDDSAPPGGTKIGIKQITFAPDPTAYDGAIIAELFLSAPSVDDPKMKVDTRVTFDIAFEGIVAPIGRFPVRHSLQNILRAVDGVISRFESLIESNPHWIPS
jgi:hypothetical protein